MHRKTQCLNSPRLSLYKCGTRTPTPRVMTAVTLVSLRLFHGRHSKIRGENRLKLVFIEFSYFILNYSITGDIECFLISLANASSQPSLGTSLLSAKKEHWLSQMAMGQTHIFNRIFS